MATPDEAATEAAGDDREAAGGDIGQRKRRIQRQPCRCSDTTINQRQER
jgi:hypothetical protein